MFITLYWVIFKINYLWIMMDQSSGGDFNNKNTEVVCMLGSYPLYS